MSCQPLPRSRGPGGNIRRKNVTSCSQTSGKVGGEQRSNLQQGLAQLHKKSGFPTGKFGFHTTLPVTVQQLRSLRDGRTHGPHFIENN
ncbi:hypothetical protein BDDG_06658 [Blastomyces dermatitidis ATCC 18188]|uniref:Uncharacterized protein n=1 Tax=Ajellomyces dermatitidis (strain ATCC 18188 / CBS 674.68) TaxID=653446 RepID=F2TKF0_AJEDA|nr:hypothetical protein BDDG_06658 [Blastomyces dermatitidis ATCC 18188]